MEFFGQDELTLSHLFRDLEERWQAATTGEPETARVYGDGGIVRDPRTSVVMPRLKDVWKGNLDKFLEAWRRERGFSE